MGINLAHTHHLAAAAVTAVLLTGCSQASAGSPPEDQPAQETRSHQSHESHDSHEGTHTMPDGTVMDDAEMSAPTDASPAAKMVCSGDVVDDVTRLLGLTTEPQPVPSWAEPMYSCTYPLAGGPLVLSVHDATDAGSGREYFESLRSRLRDTKTLGGAYGFGLPAYETGNGTVVFLKDGKTLQVDATALPGRLGPDGSMDQNDFAYAVAASVIACWTDHA